MLKSEGRFVIIKNEMVLYYMFLLLLLESQVSLRLLHILIKCFGY
jgi:hypothetical protein